MIRVTLIVCIYIFIEQNNFYFQNANPKFSCNKTSDINGGRKSCSDARAHKILDKREKTTMAYTGKLISS